MEVMQFAMAATDVLDILATHVLDICHRTLPAYRNVFSVHDEYWNAFRTEFSYLDLAVPNGVLSKKYFEKVLLKIQLDPFGTNQPELHIAANANVWRLSIKTCKKDGIRRRKFYPDDCIYRGCDRIRDFYSYSLSNEKDRIGMELFDLFGSVKVVRDRTYLECGESAVRFLHLAKVFGVADWRKLEVRTNIHRPITDRFFWYVNPFIIKGLYKIRHTHPLLLTQLWSLFCSTDETRLSLFQLVPDAEHLEFMLEVANKVKFDFWGMRYGRRGFTERIVPAYIMLNDFEYVELLLKYGFAFEGGIIHDPFKVHWCSPPLQGSFIQFDWSIPISNKLLVWFLATHIVMDADLIKLPGFVQVYRKLYRTLPLPSDPTSVVLSNLSAVLTYDRIRDATGPGADEANRWTAESSIEEIMQAYLECTVNPISVFAPRKLSHLCRCLIRDRFKANYQLPSAIDGSSVPSHIKEFLHLEF